MEYVYLADDLDNYNVGCEKTVNISIHTGQVNLSS